MIAWKKKRERERETERSKREGCVGGAIFVGSTMDMARGRRNEAEENFEQMGWGKRGEMGQDESVNRDFFF